MGEGNANGGKHKIKGRRQDQDGFAAKAVAERAGNQRPRQTAQKRATLRPASRRDGVGPNLLKKARISTHDQSRVFKVKERFVKLRRSSNDNPVVAEEQPAQRGHKGDHPQIARIGFGGDGGVIGSRSDHSFRISIGLVGSKQIGAKHFTLWGDGVIEFFLR